MNNDDELRRRTYLSHSFNQQMERQVVSPHMQVSSPHMQVSSPHMLDSFPLNLRQSMSSPPMSNIQMFHMQSTQQSQNQPMQNSRPQSTLSDNTPLNLHLSGMNAGGDGTRPVFLNNFQQEMMHQPTLSSDARSSMYSRNHDGRPFTPHDALGRQAFSPRMEEKPTIPGNNATLSALAAQLTSLADAQKVFLSNPAGSASPSLGKVDNRYSQMLASVPNLTEHQLTVQNLQLIQSDVSGTFLSPGHIVSNGVPSPSNLNVRTQRIAANDNRHMQMISEMIEVGRQSDQRYLFDNKANGSNNLTTENNLSATMSTGEPTSRRSPITENEMKDDESSCLCPVCDTSLPDVDQLKQHMLINHNVHSVIPEQPVEDVDTVMHQPTESTNCDSDVQASGSVAASTDVAAARENKLDVFSPTLSKAYTKFACVDCGAEFKNRDKLIFHVRHHTNENTLLCTICGKSFFKSDKLARHMLVHSGERPYVCKHCGATFTRSDKLRAHLKARHGDESYSCRVCRESFADIAALKLHLSKRRCSKYRPSENDAEERRKRERDALESTFNEIAAQIGDPEIDIALMVNRERLAASFDASIARDGELDAALLKDTVLKDLNDERMPDDRSYMSSVEFMDETVIVPEVNLERAKTKALHAKKIDRIVKRINKYRTVACPHCDVMLPGAYTLTRHLRITHNIVKSYQYKKKEKIPKEEGEEPVPRVRIKRPALIKHCQCLVCGKNFTKLDTLKRHEVTHTGERAFQCRFCDAKYSRSDRLRKHLRSNHVSAAYPCIKCDLIFETKEELRRHISVHRVKAVRQTVEKVRIRGPYKKRKMGLGLNGKPGFVPGSSNSNVRDTSLANTSTQEQSGNSLDTINVSGVFDGSENTSGNNLSLMNETSGMMSASGDNEPVENVFRLSSVQLSSALALRNIGKPGNNTEKSPGKSVKSEGGLATDQDGEVRVKRKYIKKKNREKKEPSEKLHECSHCPKMFKSRRAAETHESIHTTLKMFKCKYCGDQYRHYRGLQKHMRHVHNDNLHACKRCDEIFENSEELREHAEMHKDDLDIDNVRDRSDNFRERSDNARERSDNVRGRKQRVYSCRQCKKVFDIRIDLEKHRRVHKLKNVCKLEEESDLEESEALVGNLTYALYEDAELSCSTSTEPSTSSLGRFVRQAIQKSNGLPPEHPDEKITVKQELDVVIKQEQQYDDYDEYKTGHEGMGFDASELPLFDAKKNKRDGDDESGSATISVDSREYREKRRAKLLKKKRKLLTCSHCYKILPSLERLERHMKIVHPVKLRAKNKIKSKKYRRVPHRCKQCGKKFDNILELHRHMERHEAFAQRFTHDCLDCGATFSSRRHLLIHANNQHGANHSIPSLIEEVEDVKQMVVAIDEPDKQSDPVIVIRPKVEAPVGDHDDAIERNSRGLFQCCVCEMSFSMAAKLRRHLVTHSGDRPYRCRHCEQTFARSDKLRSHLSVIHFEHANACLFCDEMFETKAELRCHTIKHVEHKMICNANKLRVETNDYEDNRRRKSLFSEPNDKPTTPYVKPMKKKVVKAADLAHVLGSVFDCKNQPGLNPPGHDEVELKYDTLNGSIKTDADESGTITKSTNEAVGTAAVSDLLARDSVKQEDGFDWTV